MTGPHEQGLINIAEGGDPFDIPIVRDLVAKLEDLRRVVNEAGSLPGIEGTAGETATNKFFAAASTINEQIDYLENQLQESISHANGARQDAQSRLAQLPPATLSPGQTAVVRTAATGTTLLLGPLSLLAGEGAVQAFNGYLASRREAQAEQDFNTVSATMREAEPPPPPAASFSGGRGYEGGGAGGGTGTTDGGGSSPARLHGGGTGSGSGGSAGNAPAFVPRGYDPENTPTAPSLPAHLVPDPDAPRGPGIDLGKVPHDYRPPTADGSIGGISTMPGYVPGTLPGGGLPGGHGGGGLGSGLSAGLVAGAGGAAALSKLGRLGGGAEGATASRGVTGTGGLLGKTGAPGVGGSGLGVRGGGAGLGGMAGGGSATGGNGGTGSAARGAGMRAGAGAPGAAGGGMAGGAGGRGVGGMGGSGSRSDRKDQGRGLGGPIAPRMEDDEEIGPRSQNASAGSRDD